MFYNYSAVRSQFFEDLQRLSQEDVCRSPLTLLARIGAFKDTHSYE